MYLKRTSTVEFCSCLSSDRDRVCASWGCPPASATQTARSGTPAIRCCHLCAARSAPAPRPPPVRLSLFPSPGSLWCLTRIAGSRLAAAGLPPPSSWCVSWFGWWGGRPTARAAASRRGPGALTSRWGRVAFPGWLLGCQRVDSDALALGRGPPDPSQRRWPWAAVRVPCAAVLRCVGGGC